MEARLPESAEKPKRTKKKEAPEIALIEDAINGHWYKVQKILQPVPSVTTILSVYPKGEGLERWLGDHLSYEAAIAERDEAGKRGTIVHHAITDLLNLEKLQREGYTTEQWKMLMSFINWVEDVNPAVEANELPLVSYEHLFAGTTDLICIIDGERYVVDFKTSSSIQYGSQELQIQAYRVALEEMGWKIQKLGLVRLGTKHKRGYEFKTFEPSAAAFDAFLATRVVWEWETGGEMRTRQILPPELSLQALPEEEA
jgi:hypothetical protein